MSKNSVIFNYIPHRVRYKPKYNVWYLYYEKDLLNLFGIMIEGMKKRYPHVKHNQDTYKRFCMLMYNNSSKYIPKI
jgi:hypothetical protein